MGSMASPYRALTRSVRSAVQTSFRRSSPAARNPFASGTRNPTGNDIENAAFRRRFSYISRLPAELGSALHRVVADAKLISHLSVNSRTCSALSLGLQFYVDAADELRVGLRGSALVGPIAILVHSI